MAVAAPVMLLLVLLVIQTALWMHGDHVAADLARRTAEQSRTVGGGASVAEGGGSSFLSGLNVSVDRGAEEVRVVVDAEVPTILPGFTWPVGHEVTAPVERFVPTEAAP
ncbi:TadE/TadG family type IV pilus assembly protein [Nocardiopsis sp. MG754419]|uniref:TadE/TadG family type IV pilus assembly protein n=1 Tax=Nocardiopsis sp. MG754419 TaxID=2259865 RepID=UPI001BA823ED|nr:TadE/TadG family type IV pilus assembly protein [Nocardiopsis sp. MG754419]MBR8743776.1 pilus assembly protein [Nocardiopsis sp. MG754419]